MALAWLAFVDPVVLDRPVRVDGPDPLESAAYAADYNEVRLEGRVDAPPEARSDEEEAIALFFNASSTRMYHEALCRYLMTDPLGLRATVDLFALMDAAAADAFIQTWRLKFELGFWRPFQAIAGAADDRNDASSPEAGWAPLVPNPAYADYTSGHAAATSPFAGAVRAVLGDDTPLVLTLPTGVSRSYENLTDLEHDALNARIWGGLHFRDAMDDGYRLGHITVARVRAQLR
jgi:hypothetical protein